VGQIGRAIHLPNGDIVDNPDTVEGIVLLQKGAPRSRPAGHP